MPSFTEDLTKFAEATGLKIETIVRKVALDGYSGVMLKSPVDTGRFRGSWRVAINQTDRSVSPPRTQTDLKHGASLNAEERARTNLILETKASDVIVISNNLPYAKRLEDGWSAQTNNQPGGILALTVQELILGLRKAVSDVS